METAKQVLLDARSFVDELNEDGVIIADDEVATIETNGLAFLNMALTESYRENRTFKDYKISKGNLKNLLGNINTFDKKEFTGQDVAYPENGVVGAKAYFFTVDSDATVLIREYNGISWNVLETINIITDEEVDRKGTITPTDPNYPIQLVFSGTTYYRFSNRCLYEYKYKNIPDFKPWIRYKMPDDFGELEKIVRENGTVYNTVGMYRWEGNDELVVNYQMQETLTVIYSPTITRITDVDQVLPVRNPLVMQYIKYFVAAMIATTENQKLVNYFEEKAEEALSKAFKKQPAAAEPIQDIYGLENYGGFYYG